MINQDIPSPIDLRLMPDAQEWADTAMLKRPSRTEFFAQFLDAIQHSAYPVKTILELGSGPGFLAEYLLSHLNEVHYTALDFSPAMHQLAQQRLGKFDHQIDFIEQSFKDTEWNNKLATVDCVVTMQAVHELRHKQYATTLHQQVLETLNPNGFYLVCDHYCGECGMNNDQLYMTIDEQRDALINAGFNQVILLLQKQGMVLHYAARLA